jgi:hypothetical protein
MKLCGPDCTKTAGTSLAWALVKGQQESPQIFSRIAYEAGRIKHVVQDGNREWITFIATIYADGTSISPGLIY